MVSLIERLHCITCTIIHMLVSKKPVQQCGDHVSRAPCMYGTWQWNTYTTTLVVGLSASVHVAVNLDLRRVQIHPQVRPTHVLRVSHRVVY